MNGSCASSQEARWAGDPDCVSTRKVGTSGAWLNEFGRRTRLDGSVGSDTDHFPRSVGPPEGEELAGFEGDEDLALVVDCRAGFDYGAGEGLEPEVGAVF